MSFGKPWPRAVRQMLDRSGLVPTGGYCKTM
jgi:hypothetical protein